MNWRVSGLDGFTLVSNSDAHSPLNLGREANLFNTSLSYPAIKDALKTGDPHKFLGTIEFYPEEGKYHIDGHRACKISFWPPTTIEHNRQCPQCGKPLTLGVLYRVEELADRKQGHKPANSHPYTCSIQLVDILSEILQVGVTSKRVKQAYQTAVNKLGSEFGILHTLDSDVIEQVGIPLLAEAIQRMRGQQVDIIPGYDGQYGRISIFKDHEREALQAQQSLFAVSMPHSPVSKPKPKSTSGQITKKGVSDFKPLPSKSLKKAKSKPIQPQNTAANLFSQLNDRQQRAVEHPHGKLLIVAGPGTGKTRTLTLRIAYLITIKKVPPEHILAVTFTKKAAQEMQQRLQSIMGDVSALPVVATFHSLCYKIINELNADGAESIIDDDDRKVLIREAVKQAADQGIRVSQKPQKLLDQIILAKQQILDPDEFMRTNAAGNETNIVCAVYRIYQNLLSVQGLNDYEDLIFKVVRLLETDAKICRNYQNRFRHIFVDEYQDLNLGQYRIVRALVPASSLNRNLCVIGDPDQSIYGFRGSDVGYFRRFIDDYPDAAVIELTRNYRSTKTILNASFQVIRDHRLHTTDTRLYSQIDGLQTISILELANARAEAQAIARTIAQLVGGTGFHSIDTGEVEDANLDRARSYADFAVLVRINDQLRVLGEVFEQAGIPFQIASRKNSLKLWGLPELVSVLRAVEGYGSDIDFSHTAALFTTGMTKKVFHFFRTWCCSKKFAYQQGLAAAKRFPVAGLSRIEQQKLIDFGERVFGLKKEMAALTIAQKLLYLAETPPLSPIVKTDPKSKEAFSNLLSLSESFGTHTADFLASAALHTDTDAYLPRAEKVAFMTMHAAKGLEFPVVFIAGCEDDLIPLKRQGQSQDDLAEERRLFYVAMTRAMEQLVLTRAKRRRLYGKAANRSLSPYVTDIENRLKKDESPLIKPQKKNESQQKQLKLF
jgi:superfamily I DNA/RNA helicase